MVLFVIALVFTLLPTLTYQQQYFGSVFVWRLFSQSTIYYLYFTNRKSFLYFVQSKIIKTLRQYNTALQTARHVDRTFYGDRDLLNFKRLYMGYTGWTCNKMARKIIYTFGHDRTRFTANRSRSLKEELNKCPVLNRTSIFPRSDRQCPTHYDSIDRVGNCPVVSLRQK